MRSCSQRPSNLPASTDRSVDMSATSSYTQSARCCSATIPHGRKNLQMIFSMLPWVLSMVMKRANWSAVTYNPFSPKSMAKTSSLSRRWSSGLYHCKTPQEIEKIKKELCKIFCENDLKISIEANKTIVNS